MKAKVSSKALQDALRAAANVTGVPQYVNLRAGKKGDFRVIMNGNDTTVSLHVPSCEVESSGEITASLQSLLGLTKNRGDLIVESSNKDSKLIVKSAKGSRYYGDTAIPPFAKIEVNTEGKGKDISFGANVKVLMEDAIERISLSNIFTDDPMYVWVNSAKTGGTTVVCGDQYHFAHYYHPEVNLGKKSFSLPLATFRAIQALAGKSSYVLTLQDSQIHATNDVMTLSMPLTQADDTVTLDQFDGLVKQLKKPDGHFTIAREALLTSLSNIESVYESNVALEITSKKGKVGLVFQTGQSMIKETIKADKVKWDSKLSCKCDPALLQDILMQMTEKDVTINYMAGGSLYLKTTMKPVSIYYTCSVL